MKVFVRVKVRGGIRQHAATRIIRTFAQIDVEFSNSTIESLFRSLKHRWLFILSLTTFEAVCRAVDDRRKRPWYEYLTDHNTRIIHYALGGAVPLEDFFWYMD
jgi:hypothetical protein